MISFLNGLVSKTEQNALTPGASLEETQALQDRLAALKRYLSEAISGRFSPEDILRQEQDRLKPENPDAYRIPVGFEGNTGKPYMPSASFLNALAMSKQKSQPSFGSMTTGTTRRSVGDEEDHTPLILGANMIQKPWNWTGVGYYDSFGNYHDGIRQGVGLI